ncbi:amidohydrolase, partial [Corallococcus sp. CA053C]|uniref:amidohydrolase family protein n=1 Tax=Corallococcus sp. CA053C TaxID=2316732 RepID=UPI000EDC410A
DAHCHIASYEHTPRSFVDGAISNIVTALVAQGVKANPKTIAQMYHQKMQDPLCDELVAEMAEAGIAKSILLVPDFTHALKDCALTIEESFLRHREVLLRHPGKFEVFGGVDPRWGKDGVTLFERSLKEFGFRGFKVYPPCGYSPSDPGLFPYYELCAEYRVPVLVHIGPTSPALAFDTTNPFLIDVAARRFPSVNFILAHGSVNFAEECAMLCSHRPNVYLDVSGYQGTLRTDGTARVVKTAVSRGINHKILFGTDWPVFRLQGNQHGFLTTLTDEGGPLSELNEREQELILYRNIERLLSAAGGV